MTWRHSISGRCRRYTPWPLRPPLNVRVTEMRSGRAASYEGLVVIVRSRQASVHRGEAAPRCGAAGGSQRFCSSAADAVGTRATQDEAVSLACHSAPLQMTIG